MSVWTKFSSTDLGVLQRQLAAWRQGQSGRPRLPGEVWEAAAILAERHGLSAVARTLGLSYPKLKQSLRPRPVRVAAAREPSGFVELKWSPPPGSSSTPVGWAELRDASGRVLRLHLGHDPQAWLALADSFWRQDR